MGGEIKIMDGNAFSGLPNLTTLLINSCELKKPPTLHLVKRTLISFSLNYNRVSDFPLDYFHSFLSLEIFSVSWNSLTSIPAINYLATHLKNLGLASNRISDVDGKWRGNDTLYERLLVLWLNGNNITSVDAGMIKALPSIRFLDLSENSITHFEDPIRYLNGISSQCTISLGKNPLDCGSHLAWVVSRQQVDIDATCNTPLCVTGMALHAMSEYMLSGTSYNDRAYVENNTSLMMLPHELC